MRFQKLKWLISSDVTPMDAVAGPAAAARAQAAHGDLDGGHRL